MFAVEGIVSWAANGSFDTGIVDSLNSWLIVRLGYQASGSRGEYFLWKRSDGTDFVLSSGLVIPANTPTHFACVYDGAQQRILINGVQVTQQAATGVAANPGSGTQTLLQQVNGKVAGIATYSGTIPTNARFLAHAQAAGLA